MRLLVASNKPSNLLFMATHTHTHTHTHQQQFSAVVFLPQAGGELFTALEGGCGAMELTVALCDKSLLRKKKVFY